MARREYFFGPVKSRRLGYSLGVDIVPGPDFTLNGTGSVKVCTLDCIYCQIGRTAFKTADRRPYCAPEPVLAELKQVLEEGVEADFITFGGSGEPTLNSRLGEIIRAVKSLTGIPVAVLTNGTLFYKPQVRRDCADADVVLPSLDAGDERTFRRINRPHHSVTLKKLVEGLCDFKKEFRGRMWLEVFLVDGLNTGPRQLEKLKVIIDRIAPDKVQLNTAVRPTAEPSVRRVDAADLAVIAAGFGSRCEVVADEGGSAVGQPPADPRKTLLSILSRRPCSVDGICAALKIGPGEAVKLVKSLEAAGRVKAEEMGGKVFYKSANCKGGNAIGR